jgi:mRNA interferase MazF
MKRGDLVIVSLPGDYGKPRPAVVLQNDRLEGRLESYVIALLTTFDEEAHVSCAWRSIPARKMACGKYLA